VKEPAGWWIRKIHADRLQGNATDFARLAPECGDFRCFQFAIATARINSGAPQNFVCHPVSHPRKKVLHEQEAFDRARGAAF
jgi:hypothetical protein